jgi:hypothetical protein
MGKEGQRVEGCLVDGMCSRTNEYDHMLRTCLSVEDRLGVIDSTATGMFLTQAYPSACVCWYYTCISMEKEQPEVLRS